MKKQLWIACLSCFLWGESMAQKIILPKPSTEPSKAQMQ